MSNLWNNGVVPTAQNAWNTVTGAANGAGQWIGNAANDVGKAVTGAVNNAGQAVSNLWNNGVVPTAQGAWNTVTGAMNGAANNLSNNANAFAQGLSGNQAEVRRQQDMQRTGMPNNAAAAVAGQMVNQIPGNIANAVTGAASNLWNNGVVPTAQNAWNTVTGVGQNISDYVKNTVASNNMAVLVSRANNGDNNARTAINILNYYRTNPSSPMDYSTYQTLLSVGVDPKQYLPSNQIMPDPRGR